MTSAITVDVFQPDGATLIANVPRHKDARWLDEMNADGSGSFALHLDDEVLADHPELLDGGNIVKLRVTTDLAYRFAFQVEDVTPTLTSAGEIADRFVTLSGRGVRSLLHSGIVYPEYGLRPTSFDKRTFDFSSMPSDWYQVADWTGPMGVPQGTDPSFRAGSPEGWLAPAAEWIWSTDPTVTAPPGTNWFRKSFVLATPKSVTIDAAGDNALRLHLDGEPIITSDPNDRYAWRQTFSQTVYLAAGTHLLAAAVENYPATGGGGNPAGFLCAVWDVDAAGERTTPIVLSDTTWFVHGYGPPVPGWTGAQVLLALVDECRARGDGPVDHVSFAFDGVEDSAGVPWADLQDRTFDVGEDLLSVLTKLTELTMDTHMSSGLVLSAWGRRGEDLTASVELIAGGPDGSITSQTPTLRHGGVRNCGLVRFGSGWIEVTDAASVTARGRRETGLSVGDANTVAQAQRVADAMFDEIAESAVTLPIGMTSLAGPQPYQDFDNGDTIIAPGVLGVPSPARVMSITASDAETHVAWDLDLYPED